jgi:hypothetical protein
MMVRWVSQASANGGESSTSATAECRLGFGFGLVPDRRGDEGKMRGCRQTCTLHGAEIGAGERPRVRVGGVVVGEDVEDEREIGKRAREGPDMVELTRELQHARPRHQPVGRLDRKHAAERGRTDHRPVGLAAERERHHMGGDRRRRS